MNDDKTNDIITALEEGADKHDLKHEAKQIARSRPESNEQLLIRLCRFENPMVQAFIIDAMGKQAKYVLADKQGITERMKDHMISPELWIHCAQIINDNLEDR